MGPLNIYWSMCGDRISRCLFTRVNVIARSLVTATSARHNECNSATRSGGSSLLIARNNRGCQFCRQCQAMSKYTAPGVDHIFRQLLEYKSHTYTYLLADCEAKEAILIDPVIETVDRDVKIVKNLGLDLLYAVNTHVHADHVTGTGEIKKRIPTCKSVIAEVSKAKADVKLVEGDLIKFGKFQLETRSTPGHTNGCLTYVWHEKNMAFTGDAVLIGGCGRTDFQEGSPERLYDSVHSKILSLPEHFQLYPAHDYTGQSVTTVAEEKQYNPRLTKTMSEFVQIMNTLNLPYPKQIDKALPANMVCGVYDVPEDK